ncbi:MAG: hypothetical protein ACOCQD_01440 [archaeon]
MNIIMKGFKAIINEPNGDSSKIEIDEIAFNDVTPNGELIPLINSLLGCVPSKSDISDMEIYHAPFQFANENNDNTNHKKINSIYQIDDYFAKGFEYAVVKPYQKDPLMGGYKYLVAVYLGGMSQFNNKENFESFIVEVQRKFEECLEENVRIILSNSSLAELMSQHAIEEMGEIVYTNVK